MFAFFILFFTTFFWQVTINRKPDGPQFPGNKFAFNLNPIKKKKIFDLEFIEIFLPVVEVCWDLGRHKEDGEGVCNSAGDFKK